MRKVLTNFVKSEGREARHVQTRHGTVKCRTVLRLELADRRPRGRAKKRFMDDEYMKLGSVIDADAEDRLRWRQTIG